MYAHLKAVQPRLDEHDEDIYDFVVEIDYQDRVWSIPYVTAETLLDQHAFAVIVAEKLGCLMRREADWRAVLAEAWRPAYQSPALFDDCEETDEDIVLVDDAALLGDESAA